MEIFFFLTQNTDFFRQDLFEIFSSHFALQAFVYRKALHSLLFIYLTNQIKSIHKRFV